MADKIKNYFLPIREYHNVSGRLRYLFLFFGILALCLCIALRIEREASRGLYISEICSHNQTLSKDPMGEYSDFIVITNGDDEAVNLQGYRLSDDRNNLEKYYIPDMEISAGGSVVFWANEDDFFSDFISRDDLYTGFRISDDEEIILSSYEKGIIDEVIVPPLKSDETYYRQDRLSKWKKQLHGVSDKTGDISDDVTPPVLSAGSGFYKESFELSFSAAGNDKVYYTLDCSSPYNGGTLYTQPILIEDINLRTNEYASRRDISTEECYVPNEPVDKGTVVRAIAMDDKGRYSSETVAVYYVGEELFDRYTGTDTLSVVCEPNLLFGKEDGIYVNGLVWEKNKGKSTDKSRTDLLANYEKREKGWKRDGYIVLLDDCGNEATVNSGILSIRGNTSRKRNQKSFSFSPSADVGGILGDLFSPMGTALAIRTGGEADPITNLRNSLNHMIAVDLNLGTQKGTPCHMFLDGEYWGCYNMQSKLDERFVADYYGIDQDNIALVVDCDPTSDYETDDQLYNSLVNFVCNSDMSDDSSFKTFCDMVDINNLIDYYCTEIYIDNEDLRNDNYGLWRVRNKNNGKYGDGKWRFLLYDTDFSEHEPDADSFENLIELYDEGYFNFFAPLVHNKTFQRMFAKRFLELCETEFDYDRVNSILSDLENEYKEPMVLSIRRFSDSADYDVEDYLKETEKIRSFFKHRQEYIFDAMYKCFQ